MNDVIWCLSFSIWLISCSLVLSRCNHVVTMAKFYFIFYGVITLPDLKLYYKPIIVKIVGYWHKIRHIDNRTQSPHINLCIYSQIFYRRNQQLGKDSLFNKWFWGNWIATCKKNETGPIFLHHTQKLTQNRLKNWM